MNGRRLAVSSIAVVSPPLDHGEVASGQVAVEVVNVADDLKPWLLRERVRIDPRACHDDRAQPGYLFGGQRVGIDHAAKQMLADARSPDADDAHPFVLAVAELGAQRLAVGNSGPSKPGDIPGEVEVLLGPLADQRHIGAEPVWDDVLAVADEDRTVAQPRVAVDVLDHLGVVVGGQKRLTLAAVGHRQPADEVGQPAVLRAL